MVRDRPTLFTILHFSEFIVAHGTMKSMDLQPLLSIASFVLVTLVVRPSMATIPAAAELADESDEVKLPGLSWDEDVDME